MRGCDGPQMSMSSTPKFLSAWRAAIVRASNAVTVLLPTPPLPDMIINLFCTSVRRARTSAIPGSTTAAAPDEQTVWLGQPAQASTLPAASLWVPGQCSAALAGTSAGAVAVVVLMVVGLFLSNESEVVKYVLFCLLTFVLTECANWQQCIFGINSVYKNNDSK